MLNPKDARLYTAAILVLGLATIGGALVSESLGYLPCELCLKQRYAYYFGTPLALAALLSSGVNARATRYLLAVVCLMFLANSLLGVYHSGVEFKWWPGPADCTGGYTGAANVQDFMKELRAIRVVRCDEVSLRILGFSLANANIFISAAIAVLAALGVKRAAAR
jgi:disulfide bond formation protein DsbB